MNVWILTSEYNNYDQYGEYFIEVFANKPSHQQLTACGVPPNRLQHVLNGGGRVNDEDVWFNLESKEAI